MSSKKHWLKRQMQKLGRTRGCWGRQRLGQSQRSLDWVLGAGGKKRVSPRLGPGVVQGARSLPRRAVQPWEWPQGGLSPHP